MSGAEINNVIDNLCQRFGTVQEELIPELARMNIVKSCIIVLAIILVLMICIFVLMKCADFLKKATDEDEIALCMFVGGLTLVLASCGVWALFSNIADIVQWMIAPTAKTIEFVLEMVGK